MKITVTQGLNLESDADVFLVPVFEKGKIPSGFPTPDELDFSGKAGDNFLLPGEKPKRTLFVGLGKEDSANIDSVRKAFGSASRFVRKKKFTNIAVMLPNTKKFSDKELAEATTEGIILGSYVFDKYLTFKERKTKPIENVELFVENRNKEDINDAVKYSQIVAEATCWTRDLGNTPHRDMNALIMAEEARKLAKDYGLSITVLDREQAEKEGMNLFLSVNNGSKDAIPGRFVVLEYKPEGKIDKTICFVGKGITFDTGGISLKPSQKMEDMKYDMCGAAAVYGAMKSVAQLKPKGIHVVGITPLTDNAPSGSATKPGDIIKSKNGKTVEIINTDAEGRLILADALTYVERYKPDFTIDLATLTGACIIALGHVQAAVYFNEKVDQSIKDKLLEAGNYTGDLLWHMPLNREYFEQIKARQADIKNVGGRPAGSITAAMFLAQFAEKYPWSHIDIAGTAWGEKEKGYTPAGASGFGVRLLVDFLRKFNPKSFGTQGTDQKQKSTTKSRRRKK